MQQFIAVLGQKKKNNSAVYLKTILMFKWNLGLVRQLSKNGEISFANNSFLSSFLMNILSLCEQA